MREADSVDESAVGSGEGAVGKVVKKECEGGAFPHALMCKKISHSFVRTCTTRSCMLANLFLPYTVGSTFPFLCRH